MKAIILAAGRGKRLGNLTEIRPKCMLDLNGRPLIEWQMDAIKKNGITEIAIVRGYLGNSFNYEVHYFDNAQWEQTNMFATLMCADNWLSSDTCLVSYSDIIYSADVIQALRYDTADIAITFDPHWEKLWSQRFTNPLSDAEIFKYENSVLTDIGGSATNTKEIQGQYMGIIKFSPAGWNKIKYFIREFTKEEIAKLDMTGLFKKMIHAGHQIQVVPINSTWCEIDNERDYQLCQELFRPNSMVFS